MADMDAWAREACKVIAKRIDVSLGRVTFKHIEGGYTVYLDDDFIGRVAEIEPRRWKAVDSYMAWHQFYKTRKRAGDGLARHWAKQL